MGNMLRKYTAQLRRAAVAAAFPAMVIFTVIIAIFGISGTPRGKEMVPLNYVELILLIYAASFVATCILARQSLINAATRPDHDLIGKVFDGVRKQDKLFSDGMDAYAKERARTALEYFHAVREFELTDEEIGVLSFYMGRCYQMLRCPSNAIGYYETAREKGFSEPYAKLFEARSCAEGGDYTRSFELFNELLDNNPPDDFYFLYTDIGFLFIRQKRPDEAVEWFEKSIEKKQNYAFALSGMAIASLQKGDFAAAQDYHYKALVNHLDEPAAFRKYYEETKRLMLEMHPDWSEKTGAAHAENAENAEDADAES